ncbi:MAG: hypothetical protein ACRCXZ_09035 [Patescibacteria group bacterium]
MHFHRQQLDSVTKFIHLYCDHIGFAFVSCGTVDSSNFCNSSNGHSLMLIKLYKEGKTVNIVIDYFGNGYIIPPSFEISTLAVSNIPIENRIEV